MVIPVSTYSTAVLPGAYIFPFQFMLPENIPGNFHREDSKFSATIDYTVTAVCESFTGNSIRGYSKFQINEKLKHFISEQSVSSTENITYCCCFNKGQCTVDAKADKNAIFPGDNLSSICNISNDSQCDIKQVILELKRDFKVSAKGKTHRLNERVQLVKHNGLPAGFKDVKQFIMSIPHNVTPTTHGTLVHSTYRLKIKLVMQGAGNTGVDMPVTVYPRPDVQWLFAPPNQWGFDMQNAQIAAVVQAPMM